MSEQVDGTVNKVAGRIQDAAGALTGDAVTQIKGKATAAAGEVQDKAGDAAQGLREWTAQNPLTALGLAAVVAFVLGRLTTNRD